MGEEGTREQEGGGAPWWKDGVGVMACAGEQCRGGAGYEPVLPDGEQKGAVRERRGEQREVVC